jgi:hypothetical protein
LKLAEDHLIFLSEDTDSSKTLHGLLTLRMIDGKNGIYSLAGNLSAFLAGEMDLSEWEDRLLDYFTQWLEQKPAQARIEESMDALLYLLKKASKKEQWSRVISFGQALEPGLILGRRWGAWAELLYQIMTAAKVLGDKNVEAWVFHQLGSRAMCLGQDDEARRLLTLALHLRKEINDQEGLQITQHNLNVLRPIPVPPNVPHAPALSKSRLPRGWIARGLGAATVSLLALIFFFGKGFPSTPVSKDTPTVTKILTATASYTLTITHTSSSTPTTTPTATQSSIPTRTPPLTPCIPMFTLTTGAFLRTGPGTAYPYTSAVPAGDAVEILARNADTANTWYYIFWQKFNVRGWISSIAGQLSCDITEVPVTAMPSAPEPPVVQNIWADPAAISHSNCGPTKTFLTIEFEDSRIVASVRLRYQVINDTKFKQMQQSGNTYYATLDIVEDMLPTPYIGSADVPIYWWVEVIDTSDENMSVTGSTIIINDCHY